MFHLFLMFSLLFTQVPALDAPVTALATSGDVFYIGQGTTLTTARSTSSGIVPDRSLDLARGQIRAVAVQNARIFVLTTAGVALLSPELRLLDYRIGGGQRFAIQQNRVVIAAREAGLRIMNLQGDRLSDARTFRLETPALDVASAGADQVWVAEGEQGIRLYSLPEAGPPVVIVWSRDLHPAVRLAALGDRLLVAHGGALSLLNVADPRSLKLVSEVAIGSGEVGALVLTPDWLLVGRSAASGADMIIYTHNGLTALREVSRTGQDGAGDALALSGGTLLLGSERTGLRALDFTNGNVTARGGWLLDPDQVRCESFAASLPQPPDLALVPSASVLRWGAECPAQAYEVALNDRPPQRVTVRELPFDAQTNIIHWQVTAIQGAQRIPGPRWTFETNRDGTLHPPTVLKRETLLYTPPLTAFFETPTGTLLLVCGGLALGLAVIIGGALAIGAWGRGRDGTRLKI